MTDFRTSVSTQELFGVQPKKPEPPNEMRRFWFVDVPVAGVLALGLSIVMQQNIFFPCWAVLAFLVWGVRSTAEKSE